MFLGPITAKLLAHWIIHRTIDITHLILATNSLGDQGLQDVATALMHNKSIVAVSLQ